MRIIAMEVILNVLINNLEGLHEELKVAIDNRDYQKVEETLNSIHKTNHSIDKLVIGIITIGAIS